MKNTKNMRHNLLKNYNNVVKKYILIDNKSNYDILKKILSLDYYHYT